MGPCRGSGSQLETSEPRVVRSAEKHSLPKRGARSTAASCDEDPVRIGGSGIARKGPVVGLLDRLRRSPVDDTSIHRTRHIDLMRNQLERYLRRASGKPGLHNIYTVEPFDVCLERFLGGDALIDRHTETLKNLVAQQRPQLCLVAFCKGGDDHLERGTRTLDEMRSIKARIGALNSVQPFGNHIGRRRITGRLGEALVRFSKRRYVVGGRRRTPREQVAAPLVSCPPTENTAQPQHQEPGDHREQDDVEILKLAHYLPCPIAVLGAPGPGPHIDSRSNRAPAALRQAQPQRAEWGFITAVIGLKVPNGAAMRIDPTRPDRRAEPLFLPDTR